MTWRLCVPPCCVQVRGAGGDISDSGDDGDSDDSSDEVSEAAWRRRRSRAETMVKKTFKRVVTCEQALARLKSTKHPAFGALVIGRGYQEEGTVTLLAGDIAGAVKAPKAARGRAIEAFKEGTLILPALETKLAEACAAEAGRRKQRQPQGNDGGGAAAGGGGAGAGAEQVVTPIQQEEGVRLNGGRLEQTTGGGDPPLISQQQQSQQLLSSRGARDGMVATGSAGYNAYLPSASHAHEAAMEMLRKQNSSLSVQVVEKDAHIAALNIQLLSCRARAGE